MKIVGVVMAVGVLCVVVVALATDFVWDGDGPLPYEGAPALWTGPFHWDQGSSYPQNANDNATITDPDPSSTCTYDPLSALTINDLVISGDSPTKMTLNLQDESLTVSTLSLGHYAQVDIDSLSGLTVSGSTSLSGRIWVIADSTFNAGDVTIDSSSAVLDLSGNLGMSAESLKLDAETANASRAFKINGGTLGIINVGLQEVRLISDNDETNRRAKLWVATGGLTFGCASNLVLIGGDAFSKRVELDLDQDMTVGVVGSTTMSGYVSIDIADNKVLKASTLTISGPAIVGVVAGTNARLEAEDL
ncbi:MAG: hypothetical protein IH988_07990 [Planctomycetes bacterium]|nr:hypothetical protein [Planctomycetota bacterium]